MKDLTKGNPIRLIILFALPLMLGQLFQQFYSIVDVHIVGETLGEVPLAAVGATTPLSDFLVGFLNGFCNGFAIVVATCFGAKDEKRIKKAAGASFVVGMSMAVFLTLFGTVFLRPVLGFLNVEEQLIPMSMSYIRIIILGLIFSVLYNTCAAILRGIGDTVTPLIFLVLSAILNIGLDYLLILGFGMGVSGAALATVLSQAISAGLCMILILRKYPVLHVTVRDLSFEPSIYRNIFTTGFSMGLMISLVNLGTLILQSAINSFGPYVIVAHTAARKVTSIYMLPNSVFGSALATFAGQNFGAGKNDRIRTGFRQTMIAVCIWDVMICMLSWAAGRQIIGLITASSNNEVLYWGSWYLKFDTIFYFLATAVVLFRNTLQGMGYALMTLLSSFFELAVKALVAFMMAPVMGYPGIIICEPVAWAVMLIPLVVKWITIIRSSKFRGAKA